jgi:hypothetical protein
VRMKFMAVSAVGFYLFVLVQTTVAAPTDRACDLPRGLDQEIVRKYPNRTLVTSADLSEEDRNLFQKDHDRRCPGLVNVDFFGDGKPTWALVLIGKGESRSKAELVVAHRVRESWETTLLDTAQDSVPVVWSQGPGEYRDVHGEKKIRAAGPVIVFCGYESWAIVYAWTGKEVAKVWIRD